MIMIVIFEARLRNYAVINRYAVTWLMTFTQMLILLISLHINIRFYIPVCHINVNYMDEIRSDLSASVQVVSDEYISSCNEVLKAVDKLKLHKADGVKDYHLTIVIKLDVISVCMSHFCCQEY